MMKRKYKRMLRILMIFSLCSVLLYSFIYPHWSKNRTFREIDDEKLAGILSANLHIISQTLYDHGQSISYAPGFGGVIFQQHEDRYYVLTAAHAIEKSENVRLIIITYDTQTYNEYLSSGNKPIGLAEYYAKLPQAEIEYIDEKYDLAILSFSSDKSLKVLPISDTLPQYGEKVAVISSPVVEQRNFITYGKITSKKPVPFGDKAGKTQEKVIRHSAYINAGSSGSPVINKDLEIQAINLGGGADVFGNFRYGMAMPSDKILDFTAAWKKAQ